MRGPEEDRSLCVGRSRRRSPNWLGRGRSPSRWLAVVVLILISTTAVRAEDPGEGANCYQFVRATASGAIGSAISLTGNPHTVRRQWRSPRGWDADVLIKWPRPPERVCGGDQFSFRLELESYRPEPKDPGGYAGTVYFDVAPSFRDDLLCSDSDDRAAGCGVNLMIPESQGWLIANTWIRAPSRPLGLEFTLFSVRLTLDGSATVDYLYRIVPRQASDTQRHHDLDDPDDVGGDTGTIPGARPGQADSDEDGLSDAEEARRGTDPADPDSDDDGRTDAEEINDGTDPLDPGSVRTSGGAEDPGNDGPPSQRTDFGPAGDPCRDVGPGTWIVIAERSGQPGEPARVPVRLCGADRLGDLNLVFRFSAAVLEATGFERGAMLGAALFDANLEPPGTNRLGFADREGISGDGDIAYFDFDVVGALGSRTVLDGAVTTATRASDDQAVTIQVKDGSFTVAAGKLGDGDGDDRITSLDALMALQMSIGKLEVDLQLDVNRNGQVTALDARWILQAATGLRSL